jgi:hypothetical protein
VPRDSAIFGLPGDRENIIGLNASHSDICRFNPAEKKDKDNYVFVEANIAELCEAAAAQGELPIPLSNSIPTAQSAEALRQRLNAI